MRVSYYLLLALALIVGTPLAVSPAKAAGECASPIATETNTADSCCLSDAGSGMICSTIGGTCQLSAVFPLDTIVPASSLDGAHLLPAIAPYRAPDPLGLFRPPILSAI